MGHILSGMNVVTLAPVHLDQLDLRLPLGAEMCSAVYCLLHALDEDWRFSASGILELV